ncbi:hypothetical protein BJ508DRAFT_414860 [Ascobolus immersus RN42]|uniref:Uncharacterized protein n=1 Tax=Ascobolus immersus RN42 TaxID=1160509 RepID=A0A3N4I961_ASCIM|nr:hypothetical protein BJ508DRAFT_414860 [Ascobolus immersus RN42]
MSASTPKHLTPKIKKATPKKNSAASQSNGTPSTSGTITLSSKKSKEAKLKKKDKERSVSIGLGPPDSREKLFNGKLSPSRDSPLPSARSDSPTPAPVVTKVEEDDDDGSPAPTTTISTVTGNSNTLSNTITHPLLLASLAAHPAPPPSHAAPTNLTSFTPSPSLARAAQPKSEMARALIQSGDWERLKTQLTNSLRTTGWYENAAKIARQRLEDGSATSFEDLWVQMREIANPETVDPEVKDEMEAAIAEWCKSQGFEEGGNVRKKQRIEKEQ